MTPSQPRIAIRLPAPIFAVVAAVALAQPLLAQEAVDPGAEGAAIEAIEQAAAGAGDGTLRDILDQAEEAGVQSEEDEAYASLLSGLAAQVATTHEDLRTTIAAIEAGRAEAEAAPERVAQLIEDYTAYVDGLDDQSDYHDVIATTREDILARITDLSSNPRMSAIVERYQDQLADLDNVEADRVELVIRLRAQVSELEDYEELFVELARLELVEDTVAQLRGVLQDAEAVEAEFGAVISDIYALEDAGDAPAQ